MTKFAPKLDKIDTDAGSSDFTAHFKAAENFEPIFDRILIAREKSALERRMENSKILAPDTVKDAYKSSEGILIKCAMDCDMQVKRLVGKRVLFARYSGDDIKVNGQEFVLATDSDVFGELK